MKIPSNFAGKEILQPGSRGQIINDTLPGYRKGVDRVTRTQTNLPNNKHDVPNIKWELDRRLPSLFTYGYSWGYNQIVIPKGRLVALDKYMNQFSFDDKKAHNVMTLANGGNWVKRNTEKNSQDACENGHVAPCTGYNGKEWVNVSGATVEVGDAKEKILISSPIKPVDVTANDDGSFKDNQGQVVIGPNVPVGVLQKNQHTVNDDAANGMMPGPVLTDALIELPLFADKDKAEENPWGSAYGNIMPGDLLKADANGRFTVSPLSREELLFGETVMASDLDEARQLTAAEIEYERQQIVGQVLEVRRDLVPFGSSKYVQWALSDRMNFNEFNPSETRANYRDGEDLNERSPYGRKGGGSVKTSENLTGMDDTRFPGHPYDNTMTNNDLHMLASTARQAGNRMSLEHTLDQGIPGLTDGYNAYVGEYGPEVIATSLRPAAEGVKHTDIFMRLSKVNVVKGSVELHVGIASAEGTVINAEGQLLNITGDGLTGGENLLKVKYLDELQGLIVLEVADEKKYREFFKTNAEKLANEEVKVFAAYKKRGLSGVPTFLDWDGCLGVVSVLLQR